VVSREYEKSLDGEDITKEAKPILIVEQLWIWRWEDYIVSACSYLRKHPDSFLLDHGYESFAYNNTRPDSASNIEKIEDWRNQNMGFWTRLYSDNPFVQIGMLLTISIIAFSHGRQEYQSPLDYFEKGVVRVVTSANKYMKETESEALDIKREASLMY
jgi:hypothetical protein